MHITGRRRSLNALCVTLPHKKVHTIFCIEKIKGMLCYIERLLNTIKYDSMPVIFPTAQHVINHIGYTILYEMCRIQTCYPSLFCNCFVNFRQNIRRRRKANVYFHLKSMCKFYYTFPQNLGIRYKLLVHCRIFH